MVEKIGSIEKAAAMIQAGKECTDDTKCWKLKRTLISLVWGKGTWDKGYVYLDANKIGGKPDTFVPGRVEYARYTDGKPIGMFDTSNVLSLDLGPDGEQSIAIPGSMIGDVVLIGTENGKEKVFDYHERGKLFEEHFCSDKATEGRLPFIRPPSTIDEQRGSVGDVRPVNPAFSSPRRRR